jgi:hypothetical protein
MRSLNQKGYERFMHTVFDTDLDYGQPRFPPRRFVDGDPDWEDNLVAVHAESDGTEYFMTGTSRYGDRSRYMTLGYTDQGEVIEGFPQYVGPTEDYRFEAVGLARTAHSVYVTGTRYPDAGVNDVPRYATVRYAPLPGSTEWGLYFVEFDPEPGRANIASDIARNIQIDEQGGAAIQSPAVGEIFHVTGTSVGQDGPRALTLQYRVFFIRTPGVPPDLDWKAMWPPPQSPLATDGMGVALSRAEFVYATCGWPPANDHAVFLAAAAFDPTQTWSLGTVKYNLIRPPFNEPKTPKWDKVRHGGYGNDIPIGITNWYHTFDPCTPYRLVWPIGRSVGPQGNENTLSTMYSDHTE